MTGEADEQCLNPYYWHEGWPWRRRRREIRCMACPPCARRLARILADGEAADAVERAGPELGQGC